MPGDALAVFVGDAIAYSLAWLFISLAYSLDEGDDK